MSDAFSLCIRSLLSEVYHPVPQQHRRTARPGLHPLRERPQRLVAQAPSRLAAFRLQIHDRVAGTLLAFATLGKKTIHVMAVGSPERIFDAPDFLEHYIALRFGGWNICRFAHCRFPAVLYRPDQDNHPVPVVASGILRLEFKPANRCVARTRFAKMYLTRMA
jgi:hypothetical protein